MQRIDLDMKRGVALAVIYVADEGNRTIQKLTRAGTNWVVVDLLR
jgi:hypothetical protein